MAATSEIDYNVVNPANKWKILRQQWRYGLWALWTSIGSMMLGFDYVIGAQLASLSEFQKYFGEEQADGTWIIPATYLSAWGAIGLGCDVIASWLAAPLLEKYGRKPLILFSAFVSVVAIILQQLATNWRVHLAGRAVNGIAIGIMFTISPLWIGETCRPELRGFWLCFFNTSIIWGQMLVVIVARATSSLDTKWQWWIPVICMYIFPLMLVVVWPFFPESPYWLVREGKFDQARKSLERMYGFSHPDFYDIEIHRLQEDVRLCEEMTGATKANRTIWGFIPNPAAELECFNKENRKRTLTAICAASSQQVIGAAFVIGNATYFLQLIGVKEYFNASVVLYVIMLLSSAAAFPLSEMIGRRTLIVPSQFLLCFFLLLMGIMGCIPDQTKAGWAIVVFIYLWAIVYQVSIGATGFVLASEVATLRLRAVTQALVTMSNGVWGLIMQFTIPYMINPDAGHLGGKVGFIFFGLGLIVSILGWYLYPETRGVRFEKLDELYAKGVKPRHFKKHEHATDIDNQIGAKVEDVESHVKG
ncbi:MFS transporter [Pochonia chlamydosporia 170]|uniref:MFS transporter n=1 Tax=Pochonia chlamydosporia 170 TaxID=1380566 RepID=A0A179F493_METCM|nr:MFS transporter [Pochonia chlamydosporia 170]OAQ60247.1 MFS transporter [Pochonia chlamydosporia 170]